MSIIELAVRSCIHLICGESPDFMKPSIASGVIIQYQQRYFICTVAHFSRKEGTSVAIITGRPKDGITEIYELGDFSYLQRIEFENEPDEEDLLYTFENENGGFYLDIAIREIPLLENLYQAERIFNFSDLEVTVESGRKVILKVDEEFILDTQEEFTFFGRIRPEWKNGILDFQEQIYCGLTFISESEDYFEFNLGSSIKDYKRFKGCSGAPIIDTEGRLIGLVTHGPNDINSNSIFGFRFDVIKRWIDIIYFDHQKII